MYGIIYKAMNTQNNKVYVGQTIRSLQERKIQHLHDAMKNLSTFYFHQALRKYGKDIFTWEQIDIADTKEELDQKEIQWISFYESFTDPKKGYNSDSGGANGKVSEETRRRISEKLKGRKFSEETIQRMKAARALRGPVSQKTKDKISSSHKGRRHTEETKRLLSSKLLGKKKSDEAKQHYVERWTDEECQKRSEKYKGEQNPNYGKHLSEEARKSISEKAKARGPRKQTEEERKKRSESIKAWHARKRLSIEQVTN